MKIIGEDRTSGLRGTLIVELSRDEMSNLCGYYYSGDAKCPEFKPGMEIAISEMYRQLYELALQESQLEDARNALLRAAKLTEKVIPVFSQQPKKEKE